MFKVLLAIAMIVAAIARVRKNESLALLLIPLALTLLFIGVPEQPVWQGFMVLSMALCIAAAKAPAQAALRNHPTAVQRQQMLYRRRVLRR
jgi:hypothetical protein